MVSRREAAAGLRSPVWLLRSLNRLSSGSRSHPAVHSSHGLTDQRPTLRSRGDPLCDIFPVHGCVVRQSDLEGAVEAHVLMRPTRSRLPNPFHVKILARDHLHGYPIDHDSHGAPDVLPGTRELDRHRQVVTNPVPAHHTQAGRSKGSCIRGTRPWTEVEVGRMVGTSCPERFGRAANHYGRLAHQLCDGRRQQQTAPLV